MCVNLKTFNESFREWARQQEDAETFEDAEQSSDDTQQPAAEKKPREDRGPSGLCDELVFP